MEFAIGINRSNGEHLNIPLSVGNSIFVLGANGTGKSILMHTIYNLNSSNARKITAHRKTWFQNNSNDLTTFNRTQFDIQIKSDDINPDSRFRDNYYTQRSSISIYELINAENLRARSIANAFDKKDLDNADKMALQKSPIHKINELFSLSNMPIVLSLNEKEEIFASKNGSPKYSIAELSDGERNALLICTDVLTFPPNTLILLDEPEKHLHRSIISPLLSSLFIARPDCAFVISTHDVLLPMGTNSNILLLRGCTWANNMVSSWEADLITNTQVIPDDIKKEILGAKRNILFVEGDSGSLDFHIYHLIYPEYSVIPKGNCSQVEKVVDGIRETNDINWINAIGIIDADDRTDEQIVKLAEKKILALKSYSVEYLYYNVEIIKKVSSRFAAIIGRDELELFQNAISSIIADISPHRERLCKRLSEKTIRNKIMYSLPKNKEIEKETFKIELDLKEILEKEEELFDQFIEHNDVDSLLARYPIRETPVLNNIAKRIGIERNSYENMVRKLIKDDQSVISLYHKMLKEITNLIYPA